MKKPPLLTDVQIDDLIREPKKSNLSVNDILKGMEPTHYRRKGRAQAFRQVTRRFARNNGKDEWIIYLRQVIARPLDFSCGLSIVFAKTPAPFSLRRYNGNSHEHSNKLDDKKPFRNFHIHQATEKYQQSSYSVDHYAEPTDLYTDLHGAFTALLQECNVSVEEGQPKLFR